MTRENTIRRREFFPTIENENRKRTSHRNDDDEIEEKKKKERIKRITLASNAHASCQIHYIVQCTMYLVDGNKIRYIFFQKRFLVFS